MATSDYQEDTGSPDDMWSGPATFLGSFPDGDSILEALPALIPGHAYLDKSTFLHWVDFTLEHPDEIWQSDALIDPTVYYYVSFLDRADWPPAFVVEVARYEDSTEVNDFTMVLWADDLNEVRSGWLVYSLEREWEKERLVRKLNEEALTRYDEGRLEDAKTLIDRAIELSGRGHAYLFNNRGLISWKMGRTEDAKRDFLESVKLDESNGDPYFNLGLIHFDESDYDQARGYLEKAVMAEPADSQFLAELGHVYLELELEDEALKQFELAFAESPEDPQVDFHLGYYFLYKKKEPKPAIRHYLRGLEKDPDDQFALADLAVAHWLLGHTRKAREIRKRLQKLVGLMPYTVSRLVYLNMEMGDFDSALQFYHRALAHSELFEPEWLHYNAALIYAETGRPEQAMNSLELAVHLGGDVIRKRARRDKILRRLKGLPAFDRLVKVSAKTRT
jgi:tetratricopeptide (TPR) repeat protein